ncbi:hypothetical protein COT78_04190 [Candidatus Berkelbacteria bacterium CG10_big_fil_rev_8_21_14_0_10_43_13]|uniref:PRC-barrel domain-containing protein n=1 Tax=Candidatus Berkelbacteria bacterium CG10_big_fil_rev_8_21_14_0_10_43_13 TaxID=1974514 RepID=A0A2H0W7J4_9BACT|nr:MAG: hypothetical protein COT78_04190 [Candidatus Berkelbacteria bacterium CG10_big_fil_rev_8_21_14_0_10_43_13]
MLILYSKLIGAPIAEIKEAAKLGSITDFVINNDDLTIAAAVVEIGLPLISKKKIVSATDFVRIFKDGIIVSSDDAIVELDEIVRVAKLYEQKCHGLAQKVVTKSGQYIGHVYDYLINSNTGAIQKFYVKKMFTDRIIPASAVISMEGKLITIKDDKPYVFVPTVETALD